MGTIKEQLIKIQEDVAVKAISSNLYTLMNNIRNGSAEFAYQRRWIWELIQNAMDTTSSEKNTKIEIEFNQEKKYLKFRHNGNPFTLDNISNLVNQQSSKPRKININDKNRTIGKFGTGFITTHLLSEKIKLRSVLINELSHKSFELVLDRTGKDELELYAGVTDALNVLIELDSLPEVQSFNPLLCNTEFEYYLNGDTTEIAQVGIRDLDLSLPFTMAFVKTISEVNISDEIIYKYKGFEVLEENIQLHTINISNQKDIFILTLESQIDDAIIAIEITRDGERLYFKASNENCPRLFCNYPFIGTEAFNIPVIFNSSSFNVYQERRNGIILKDADTDEINENKKILQECIRLYKSLIDFIANSKIDFKNTHILANFQSPFDYEWLSQNWYTSIILNPVQDFLLHATFVEEEGSEAKVSMLKNDESANVWFPYHSNENICRKIWNLANFWLPHIPKESQFLVWNLFLFEKSKKLTLEVIANTFNNRDFEFLQKSVTFPNRFYKNHIEWLNEFYKLIDSDLEIIKKVNSGKLLIIPDQNGKFVNKNLLYWDKEDFPEELKDIMKSLGRDIRSNLMHKAIFIEGMISIDRGREMGIKQIAQIIISLVNKHSPIKGTKVSESIQLAYNQLYLWFCDNPELKNEFGDLYTYKETRLMDENHIKSFIQKGTQVNKILEKHGLNNLEELSALIEKGSKERSKEITSENILITLGITSSEALMIAKDKYSNNKEISSALQHFSEGDYEKLQQVHDMIERSKKNVKDKLMSIPDYDCKNWEEASITTVNGIRKNGNSIKLVIRPGDGGQIILFYPEELDVLDDNINELWYDNLEEQAKYTFGKFLKKTKINKMPI